MNFSGKKFVIPNIFNGYSYNLYPIAVFSLAFYLQYSIAFLGLDLHHDLFMFDAARNFYSGQIPYKDFFYQYNLGTLFLHGATLGLLGMQIIALKKVTVLFYALIALLIYLTCSLEGAKRSGFLLSVLWALLSPFYMPAMNGYHAWPTIYMMFACMVGLLCLQIAIRRHAILFGSLSGVFFCLGFWFKQVAALQIIAVLIWLAFNILCSFSDKVNQLKYVKIFSGFALGGVAASIPFFGYLYSESAIQVWWIDAFEFNNYFSADSQNATGIGAFVKILFPISRDMGYRSIIWALSPVVLCILCFQVFIYRGATFTLSRDLKQAVALFALAGFSGWLEYFPLPHSFHTQIFMAPTFVVIGVLLSKHPISFNGYRKSFLLFVTVYIFIICSVYEDMRHIKGWVKKTSEYNINSTIVNLSSSFDGLKIDSITKNKLALFYKNFVDLKISAKGREFIPLSVDPIRGLLPGIVSQPSEFKMGVDWTWPNELVEPGFAGRVYEKIVSARQPIYGDSLIYIPGYKPIALLEMNAPVSWTHTLYKPFPGASKPQLRLKRSSEILYVTEKDFDFLTRSNHFEWNSNGYNFNLIPFEELSKSEFQNVKNIHIFLIEESDFPQRLSALQFNYLKAAGKYFGGDLFRLFNLDDAGGAVLRTNITLEEKKRLALFMLSSGKLFVSQNRPLYASTFEAKNIQRPFIAGLSKDSPYLHILWNKVKDNSVTTNRDIYKDRVYNKYLAIKPIMNKKGSKFIFVQIEFKDDRMFNYFYSFLNDES